VPERVALASGGDAMDRARDPRAGIEDGRRAAPWPVERSHPWAAPAPARPGSEAAPACAAHRAALVVPAWWRRTGRAVRAHGQRGAGRSEGVRGGDGGGG